MAERILAIDPGEKVGWATGEIEAVGANGAKSLRVTGHGISHLKPFALKLHEVLTDDRSPEVHAALHNPEPFGLGAPADIRKYDVVVLESYRIAAGKAREHAGSDVPTLQLVGMVRLCCWLTGPGTTLVMQPPRIKSQAELTKPQWLAETLAGLPRSHDEAHDGDALLHLWHFFFKHHFDPTLEA